MSWYVYPDKRKQLSFCIAFADIALALVLKNVLNYQAPRLYCLALRGCGAQRAQPN